MHLFENLYAQEIGSGLQLLYCFFFFLFIEIFIFGNDINRQKEGIEWDSLKSLQNTFSLEDFSWDLDSYYEPRRVQTDYCLTVCQALTCVHSSLNPFMK